MKPASSAAKPTRRSDTRSSASGKVEHRADVIAGIAVGNARDLSLGPGVEAGRVGFRCDDTQRPGLRARPVQRALRSAQRLDALDVDEARVRTAPALRDRLLVKVERRRGHGAELDAGSSRRRGKRSSCRPARAARGKGPGCTSTTSSICFRPRIAMASESNAADRLGNVLEALGALRRGDDDLAEPGDRRRLLLRGRRARGYREYRGNGGREGLWARTGPAKDGVSHVLPSAVFRILATARRPGKPSPVARRMAATYQSRNSWVNDSMDSESGPGS